MLRAAAVWRGRWRKATGRKRFFFEKKKQKTSIRWSVAPRLWHPLSAAGIPMFGCLRRWRLRSTSQLRAKHPEKVFWFFFSKKNILPSLPFD
jgi:hypothetical protein